ncbi:MAG: 6-phosphogluconolactonase [Williamsia sp.]|nr:6-phosphogluconolactonase [Williamsia sp.]
MHIYTYNNPDELSYAVADWMINQISETVKKTGRFTIALSGGSTPQRLYSILATEPYSQKIDWSKLHIFYGDERVVPFEDTRNNAKMSYDTLLNHVPVPASQIHIMKTDIGPEEAARQYEAILHEYFDHSGTTFDLTLLGMGDDGHTLSVFPGSELVDDKAGWARAIWVPAQDMYRITLTPELVNKSAVVAFLTTGANKSAPLKQVIKGAPNPHQYPSQLIKPTNGELYWFVDKEAAKELSEP